MKGVTIPKSIDINIFYKLYPDLLPIGRILRKFGDKVQKERNSFYEFFFLQNKNRHILMGAVLNCTAS